MLMYMYRKKMEKEAFRKYPFSIVKIKFTSVKSGEQFKFMKLKGWALGKYIFSIMKFWHKLRLMSYEIVLIQKKV